MSERGVLLESLQSIGENDRQFREIVARLGEIGIVDDVPFLARLLENDNPDVRGYAAQALGQLASSCDSAMIVLLCALESLDVTGQITAILALGQSRRWDVVPTLANLTSAPHMQVAEAAAMALTMIGTQEALSAIKDWKSRAERVGWYRAG